MSDTAAKLREEFGWFWDKIVPTAKGSEMAMNGNAAVKLRELARTAADELDSLRSQLDAERKRGDDYYNKLVTTTAELEAERTALQAILYQVASKHEGETRYETTLRYVREREERSYGPEQAGLCQTAEAKRLLADPSKP